LPPIAGRYAKPKTKTKKENAAAPRKLFEAEGRAGSLRGFLFIAYSDEGSDIAWTTMAGLASLLPTIFYHSLWRQSSV
jgi:hypothetical protein